MKRLLNVLLFVAALSFSLQASAGYDPTIHRWLQRDPIGEAGGLNLYTFVNNNPVNVIDPFGLEGNPISSTLSGLTGAWNSSPYGSGGTFYSPGYAYNPPPWYPYPVPTYPPPSPYFNAWDPNKGQWYIYEQGLQSDPVMDMVMFGIGGALRESAFVPCPQRSLTGADAARAALGKGPYALPGAPLTAEMRAALQQNLAAAQNSLNLAKQGLNVAGNATDAAQLATQIATAQARIDAINAVLRAGVQAPKN